MYKLWDIQYKNHGKPVFITKKDTAELLYYNELFSKLFQIGEEYIGKSLYQLIEEQEVALENAPPDWELYANYKSYGVNNKYNLHFLMTACLTVDKQYIFAELEVGDFTNSSHIKFDEAMSTCVEIFAKPRDEIIPSLMALLCDFYQSHSAFINRVNEEKKEMLCEFEWCSNPEFQREINNILTENTELLFHWMEQCNETYIIEANQKNKQDIPYSKEVLELFSLDNVTAQVIKDSKGKIVAVVGLNNRKEGIFDYRLLKTISTFIGQGLNQVSVERTLDEIKEKDSLTSFFSRSSYGKKVESLTTEPPQSLGIVFVNVNGLKEVNEKFGYSQGDRHIKDAAEQVISHLPYQFYRLAGDEFVGIVENIPKYDFEDACIALQRCIQESSDYHFAVGFSYGSRNYTFPRLLQEAETMMYINKQEYYSSSNRSFHVIKDKTLSELMSYLANDEFMVYLQPQVKLEDGSLHGAEALIRRFDKSNQKMVFPDQFIPLYEKKSVIRHVDMYVLETVCKLQQQWLAQGTKVPISVNFSRVTLQEYGIVENIVKICDKYQIPHPLIVIEVTERMGLIENNVPSLLIQQFKEENFFISLDDFGCAYSNIVTLAKISVDEVKIDKSLIDDVLTVDKNRIIVDSMITMCRRFTGTSTLAEGIETQEQADFLKSVSCHLGQGYLYSRPIPIQDFCEKYIKDT